MFRGFEKHIEKSNEWMPPEFKQLKNIQKQYIPKYARGE